MQCIKTRIEWLKRIIAALTGTCIFGDAVTFINKDCRVLFGDIFIVPFLGPALGWTAMCSPGWGNLVAIDWNDLPVGREFDGKFLENVQSPTHALRVSAKFEFRNELSLKSKFSLILFVYNLMIRYS